MAIEIFMEVISSVLFQALLYGSRVPFDLTLLLLLLSECESTLWSLSHLLIPPSFYRFLLFIAAFFPIGDGHSLYGTTLGTIFLPGHLLCRGFTFLFLNFSGGSLRSLFGLPPLPCILSLSSFCCS